MKRVLSILFLSLAAYAGNAQVKPEAMAGLMKHRMYSSFEVEYNAILLAQDMYHRGSFDSLDALCAFWAAHTRPNERLFSLAMLNSIRANRFREFVSRSEYMMTRNTSQVSDSDVYRPSILFMLTEYQKATKGSFSDEVYRAWQYNNCPLPKDVTDYYNFYEQYYAFLIEMAQSLIGKRSYTALEEYLLNFYAYPETAKYSGLDSSVYNGTVLQERYKAYNQYRNSITGVGIGLRTGVWIPHDKLALLGNHPYLGYSVGGKSKKFAWDIVMDIRFLKSANEYQIVRDGALLNTNYFSAINVGLEFSHQLLRFGSQQFDFQWALGYEGIQAIENPNNGGNNTQTATKNISSLYFSPGFVWRVYTGQRFRADLQRYTYLALAARYHFVDFKNAGGTDLHGNYTTVGVIWGSYRNSNKKFPVLDK